MQYAIAKANAENRRQSYEYHMSSVLCMIAENTAMIAGPGGRYCTKDFYEIISKPHQQEHRTGREIVQDIASRMGLEVVDDGTS